MNRRDFFKRTGIGGALAAAWPAGAQSTPSEPASPGSLAFTTSPVLLNPTETAVTVVIGVNGPSTAWVEYGETEQLGRLAAGARHGLRPFDALAHCLRLEGLRPGQRCFYRVHACPIDFRNAYDIRRGEAISTQVFSFQTLDAGAAEARFVVWNDTHENATTLVRLRERSAPLPSDFLVWNGDITNDNYREDRMVAHYLGAGGQPFACTTPLFFVRGNHDTRGPAARALPRFMEPPGGRYYYSFRHGPLAGVVLDGGEDKPDTHKVYAGLGDFVAYAREQAAWLETELDRPHLRQAPFRVAFCHIPFWWQDRGFASDPNDARSAWHPLLVKGQFAAVISGHTHRFAVFPPDERKPYAQLIGGSPKPEDATLIRGVVTAEELTLTVSNLEGQELGRWSARG